MIELNRMHRTKNDTKTIIIVRSRLTNFITIYSNENFFKVNICAVALIWFSGKLAANS